MTARKAEREKREALREMKDLASSSSSSLADLTWGRENLKFRSFSIIRAMHLITKMRISKPKVNR